MNGVRLLSYLWPWGPICMPHGTYWPSFPMAPAPSQNPPLYITSVAIRFDMICDLVMIFYRVLYPATYCKFHVLSPHSLKASDIIRGYSNFSFTGLGNNLGQLRMCPFYLPCTRALVPGPGGQSFPPPTRPGPAQPGGFRLCP